MSLFTKIINFFKRLFGGNPTPSPRPGPSPSPKPGPAPSPKPGVDPAPHPGPVNPPIPPPVKPPDFDGNPMDSEYRIQIKALGSTKWKDVWWFGPWLLAGGYKLDPVHEWQIRFSVGCDEKGVLGPAPFRGYDLGTSGDMTSKISARVPPKWEMGKDDAGRTNPVMMKDGVQPVLMTDKCTMATRCESVYELVKYTEEHPEMHPWTDIGDGTGGGGNWIGTD